MCGLYFHSASFRLFYHFSCGALSEDRGASYIIAAFLSGRQGESILVYMNNREHLFMVPSSPLFPSAWILIHPVPVGAAVAEYVNPASYLMNHIGIHPAESDIFIIFQMAYIFAPGVKKKGFAGIFRIS